MAGDSTTSPPGQRDSDQGILRPGQLFAGHRIEYEAGRGATGVVYAAFHLKLHVTRALKVLSTKAAGDPVFRARFEQESQLAAALEHPNIVPVYEAGESGDALYLSMRFVDGPNLSQLLSREGPLAPERAVALVAQLAAALDAAHEHGLVHRDVKPANVLLEGAGDSERAFLGDFGISRLVTGAKELTETGEMVGTVNYVAPEQIAGASVDARTDVYSLACVAYEALTGAPPFKRETQLATMFAHANDSRPKPSQARGELSSDVDRVFARALAIDPDARHARASDFTRELDRAVAGERLTRRRPTARSRLRALGATGAAIAAIVAVLAITGVLGGSGTRIILDDGFSSTGARDGERGGRTSPRFGRGRAVQCLGRKRRRTGRSQRSSPPTAITRGRRCRSTVCRLPSSRPLARSGSSISRAAPYSESLRDKERPRFESLSAHAPPT